MAQGFQKKKGVNIKTTLSPVLGSETHSIDWKRKRAVKSTDEIPKRKSAKSKSKIMRKIQAGFAGLAGKF